MGHNLSNSTQKEIPALTRRLCLDLKELKNTLRVARNIDDSIRILLNSSNVREYSRSKELIGISEEERDKRCLDVQQQLFASWLSRTQLLDTCEHIVQSEAVHQRTPKPVAEASATPERLDPYAKSQAVDESVTTALLSVIANERQVENIVRDRSWEELTAFCPNLQQDWRDVFR
ncbi:caffeine induced death protein Cid2 [Schizosaccharomyces japonicus yFS275]|uniref:Caffeine induced death protein Cid2 n=1 Tax=Schizosaccharomyces japonicus (strain yFS275 / FY16936) TaxID=402676 RepID=B6K1I7_SCHJY|nr:caffeine induced death protein Cid2 [Schizosaccharomyces japonicus yFS275]EEB07808.1 caffeine induced death protein Cid2 [Schizosaccharomyces japonicus yFS275]